MRPGGQYGYEKTREFYQIHVNGKLSLVRAKNGYITIDRVWKNNDVVRMVMATPIRRITRSDGLGKGKFALQYGPIVYGYCSDDANAFFRASDPIAPHYDKDVLHTNMLIAKIYNSRTPGDETPWNCNLYPYYILPSLKARCAASGSTRLNNAGTPLRVQFAAKPHTGTQLQRRHKKRRKKG